MKEIIIPNDRNLLLKVQGGGGPLLDGTLHGGYLSEI